MVSVPSFIEFQQLNKSSEAQLLDSKGVILHRLRLDPKRRVLTWINLSSISPRLITTIIQAEDQHYYRHWGVDPKAIISAIADNFHRKRPRGASTITMQLATVVREGEKQALIDRNIFSKLQQIRYALAIERKWSKAQILEAYLNRVTFRGELVGVDAASKGLFNKGVDSLDLSEAAVLTALLRAPSASRETIGQRACLILKSLHSPEHCEFAIFIAAGLPKSAYPIQNESEAPHLARQLLHQPGERVTSTLNASLQRFVTETLYSHLATLSEKNVEDGAVVILDNRTGNVLAYVGSSGTLSRAGDVDGVMALRQPGSTLKPFLYGLAIDQGWLNASSILDDSPLALTTPSGLYIPQDYDRSFRGAVSVRTALASSLNVPAVRTLTLVGVEPFLRTLHRLGLHTLTRSADHYGYGLALGGAEVNLLSLTNAYRTLSNEGKWTPIHFLAAPISSSSVVEGNNVSPIQALSPQASFIISDILADASARASTFGFSSPLSTRIWAAVKTGTSKGMRDNWAIGFTQNYTVGVWVGNFSGASMWDVSGVTGAAPLWHDIIEYMHANQVSSAPQPPKGVIRQEVVFKPEIEATRKDWIISTSDSALHASALASLVHIEASTPHLIAPANGTIIAPDPDIPQPIQSILIQGEGNQHTCLKLNTISLAPCGTLKMLLPLPSPGQYTLTLTATNGKLLDQHSFTVRALSK
ncbi:MAG: penicillin-binding protein 1C [Pseudomonadota bacterium]